MPDDQDSIVLMNKQLSIILVSVGAFLGVLLSWQFASNVTSDSNFVADEVVARESLIKEFLDEQAYFQSRIVFLRKEIEKEQELIKSQSNQSSLDTLNKLKAALGLTEISGAGLEITLSDNPVSVREGDESNGKNLIQAADIRDVVNVLNAASSDGISVNGQRVISSSPISSVGTTILVNNSYISPPFVISAVGDRELIIQRLGSRNLLPELYKRIKENKIGIKISLKDWLRVPIYNGDLRYNYITLVE